jgi:SWI/SNF-related matrix-associated actin-dependent regulator 1 of chromatin subfamily A
MPHHSNERAGPQEVGEPRLYQIKAMFAKKNKLPVFFVARELAGTQKAVYLYGHGTTETKRMGVCAYCGKTLTHPVSVLLGVGPICGGHYHNWDAVGGYTEENIKRLTRIVEERIVDSWLPRCVIREVLETRSEVPLPQDHPFLKKTNRGEEKKEERKAEQMPSQHWSEPPVIKITFPFSWEDVDRVKTLPNSIFKREGERYWTVPLSLEVIQQLKKWGFSLDKSLEQFLSECQCHVDQVESVKVKGLKMKLFPFQEKGVAFIEARKGKALIADEMGLGKTAQALAWLGLHPEKRPVIIVVPASLKLNWEREAHMWLPNPKVQIISGTKTGGLAIRGEIIIINYDILDAWLGKLQACKARVLILDECHYIKSNKARRTKVIKALAKGIPHIICLSGTPIVNRPIEMYNALKLVGPTVIPPFWTFVQRYCGAKHNGFGWNFNGASNTEELHKKLTNSIMIRRRKADVLQDLPPKIRSVVPMEMIPKFQKEYNKAEADFIGWVRKSMGPEAAHRASNAEALAKIEALKQIAIRGKLDQAIAWIKNFLEVDGKLVVFVIHRATVNALMQEFRGIAVKIDGSVPQTERQQAVDAFQENKEIRLFVGNIKAAGLGITLTAASSVVFLELGWSPGEHDQAEDRIHRIGQKAQSIQAHYLLAAGTIEERIARIIDGKRRVLDQILDGRQTEEASLLAELLNEFSNRD